MRITAPNGISTLRPCTGLTASISQSETIRVVNTRAEVTGYRAVDFHLFNAATKPRLLGCPFAAPSFFDPRNTINIESCGSILAPFIVDSGRTAFSRSTS